MDTIRVPELLFVCGFQHNDPKVLTLHSKGHLLLTGFGGHGLPFGRVRALALFLASKSVSAGRSVRGSLDEIRTFFDVDWSMETIKRHLLRLINCSFVKVDGELSARSAKLRRWSCRNLDVIRQGSMCLESRTFQLELGRLLIADESSAPTVPFAPVKALVQREQYQLLDLLLWAGRRLARGDYSAVAAFGPDGPFARAPFTEAPTARPGRLYRLVSELGHVWRDCPFRVVRDARGLMLIHAPDTPYRYEERRTRRAARQVLDKLVEVEKQRHHTTLFGEVLRRMLGRAAPSPARTKPGTRGVVRASQARVILSPGSRTARTAAVKVVRAEFAATPPKRGPPR